MPPDVVGEHDVLINCAGHVTEGERFVSLFDHVVTAVESLPAGERPVCWLLAGAALLDIDAAARRGRGAAESEVHLLAASRQLRAPRALEYRLALRATA